VRTPWVATQGVRLLASLLSGVLQIYANNLAPIAPACSGTDDPTTSVRAIGTPGGRLRSSHRAPSQSRLTHL
jgi:hypothetical protein